MGYCEHGEEGDGGFVFHNHFLVGLIPQASCPSRSAPWHHEDDKKMMA